jgi:hypothetical protein
MKGIRVFMSWRRASLCIDSRQAYFLAMGIQPYARTPLGEDGKVLNWICFEKSMIQNLSAPN